MPHEQYLNTAAASAALGVSVSTVKRWVDEGILPAHKTPGGHRKLLLNDLLRVARENGIPRADLCGVQEALGPALPATGKKLVHQLYKALRSFDGEAVAFAILGAYRNGMRVETLADEVIGPVMRRIGHDWAADRIDVLHEHRATQLVAAALYRLKAEIDVDARGKRPVAIGGAPEFDHYVLPSLLAQLVLLDLGWEAVNLGPNTPTSSFLKALDEYRPRICWLSASYLEDADRFVREYHEIYREAEDRGIAVVIGGFALSRELGSRVPHTVHGAGMEQLAAFARALVPPPKRPRRGRRVSPR